MKKKKEQLKCLLLQIRDEQQTRQEEFDSFCRYSTLAREQIDVLNVFDTPHFKNEVIDHYDALFVGGASEASVLQPEKYPFVSDSQNLLNYCLQKNIPVFASCFGFQLAVLALKGTIIKDGKDFEMGTLKIQTTQETSFDPIFENTPKKFFAVAVHREMATELPKNCTRLAFTDKCLHAFKVNNKPFWAFQFHPEVSKDTLVQRLTIFKEKYTEDINHLNLVLSRAVETPYSNKLVQNFIDFLVTVT